MNPAAIVITILGLCLILSLAMYAKKEQEEQIAERTEALNKKHLNYEHMKPKKPTIRKKK